MAYAVDLDIITRDLRNLQPIKWVKRERIQNTCTENRVNVAFRTANTASLQAGESNYGTL